MKKFFFLFFLPCILNADPSPSAEGKDESLSNEKAVSASVAPKDLPWQQSYNDGREDYYKNDFDHAHQHFSEALRKCPKPEYQEQIFYNLGNTCYQQSQPLKDEDPQKVQVLEQSVQNYKSALSLDKEAKDTQNNLKMAERELDRVMKKQNDNKKDNNDKDNKDNKDDKDNKNSNNNNDNKDNKDNKNSDDNRDNKDKQQGKPDNKDQNQHQQNQENKEQQDQKEPQDKKNPQNQPQQQQESPDKKQESPSPSQPQANPNSQQPPKPQSGAQAPQPEHDPKKQEIENILKKAANSERMFPQANQAGAMDEPILKDW